MWKDHRAFISLRVLTLFTLVVSLGFILKLDLYQSAPLQTVASNQKELKKKSARTPASLPSTFPLESPSPPWVEPHHVATLEWNCLKPNKLPAFKNISQIRLNGACLKAVRGIKNIKNGYTASLFKLEKNATTDYLNVDVGLNQIELEWNNGASGNFAKVLEISVEKQ